MKKEMMIFEKEEFGKVRIVMQDEQPWFVASDVASALGYEKPNNAVNSHCKKVNKISYPETGQPLNIIPESDLYRLIMRSQLESAEKFQDWVVEEVLPSIRKTGEYNINKKEEVISDLLGNMPKLTDAFDAMKRLASTMGFDENQSLFSANHAVKRISGVDCMDLVGFKQIEYKPNIQYHTPSILGDMCGLSAIKINKILEEKGLQEESRDNKNRLIWVVTEKGKQHSRVFDTGKMNKNGSPVQQIKWSEEVLNII